MVSADTSEGDVVDRGPVAAAGRRHGGVSRTRRAESTRSLLMRTAERLYAEHGLSEVSNRQIAEAAGQANTSAVAYHVGTKTDLIMAISAVHADAVSLRAHRMLEQLGGAGGPREYVSCLVRPYVEHLDELGTPSWCARFTAQITTDPAVRDLAIVAATSTPPMQEALAALARSGPHLGDGLAALRSRMIRLLIVHTCAEHERDAEVTGLGPNWSDVADALIDASTAVLLAPPGDPGGVPRLDDR